MPQYENIVDIYAQIPRIHCKQKCSAACGPLMMSPTEQHFINQVYGETDFSLENAIERKCLTCPKLVKGKCSIYFHRPLICRLFGTTKKLKCPFGCRPKRWLTEEKSRELIKAAQNL